MIETQRECGPHFCWSYIWAAPSLGLVLHGPKYEADIVYLVLGLSLLFCIPPQAAVWEFEVAATFKAFRMTKCWKNFCTILPTTGSRFIYDRSRPQARQALLWVARTFTPQGIWRMEG